jgi:steroid 5-alpha reductase family enzyme
LLFTSTTPNLNILNFLGLVIIIIGFFWEMIADIQLNRFKKEKTNQNTFLKSGLWSLSRHPNYFGEILFWWGIFIFSIVNFDSFFSIIGPIIYSYLIINVTGVKTMDKRMSQNYDGYSDYIKNSNSLIPKIF